jgi:hypothetical protein
MKYFQREQMHMSGGMPSVKVVLRNPLDYNDKIDYDISVTDTELSNDWITALKKLLQSGNLLEKNFCFMGFPKTSRTLEHLCNELNSAIYQINTFNTTLKWQQAGLPYYLIEEYFTPNVVRFGDDYTVGARGSMSLNEDYYVQHLGLLPKQQTLNRLHNHFEVLQGTVNCLSEYYKIADYETKYAIRELNNLCHEIENLVLSQQKEKYAPQWIRPSQITTWLHAPRYELTDIHRQGFLENGFNRKLGGVYMHWAQIGKTYFEVFRDENAPELTETVCEAITQLQYYSGEFDVDWGLDMVYGESSTYWHTKQQDEFRQWLIKNNLDPNNPTLSNGHLLIGNIELKKNFGTDNHFEIWDILSSHLDIYSVEVDGIKQVYDYCWSDRNYKQIQIDMMKPGYDYSSSWG